MDICKFEDVMTTIPLLRQEYQRNNKFNVLRDIIAVTFKAKEDKYYISLNLITFENKVLSMEWSIDLPFSIPEEYRKLARFNPDSPISIEENQW